MEFKELLAIIGDEPIFETALLLAGDVNPVEIRRQLSRWKRSGKIIQLRRGLYSLAPPFRKVNPHPFLVANRLVVPSYVSLQSALAYYGLIPEYVPVTTSVTTNRPSRYSTSIGLVEFRHLQLDFFFGYHLADLGGRQQAFLAQPEKALLDLIYLEPKGETLDFLGELRLSNLSKLDWQVFEAFVWRMNKPKLTNALANIRILADEEGQFVSL